MLKIFKGAGLSRGWSVFEKRGGGERANIIPPVYAILTPKNQIFNLFKISFHNILPVFLQNRLGTHSNSKPGAKEGAKS